MYYLRVIHEDKVEENFCLGDYYKCVNTLSAKPIENVCFFAELYSNHPKAPIYIIGANKAVSIPLYCTDKAYIILDDRNTYTKVSIPVCNVTSPDETELCRRIGNQGEDS